MRGFSVRNERGIALVIAIVALVIIGAIVAGTFFISTIEQRTAGNTVTSAQALQAAEAGNQAAIAFWSPTANSLANGDSLVLSQGTLGGSSATYQATIYRLNSAEYLIRSVGTMGGTVQAVGSLLKLNIVRPGANAAVTSFGSVRVAGNSTIDGNDNVPAGWSCSSAANRTGIRTHGTVTTVGNATTVTGSPATVQHDSSFDTTVVSGPFNQLKALATITVGSAGSTYNPPGNTPLPTTTTVNSSTVCNVSSTTNWGEPRRSGTYVPQCISYFPVVYVAGSVNLPANSRGQGILLVQEDASIAGGFEWTGLIIVHGQVTSTGTGAKITGAMMSMNDANVGDIDTFSGNPTVLYSRCAVDAVLQNAGIARPMLARSWTQLY